MSTSCNVKESENNARFQDDDFRSVMVFVITIQCKPFVDLIFLTALRPMKDTHITSWDVLFPG
jgi:hypothetical protein